MNKFTSVQLRAMVKDQFFSHSPHIVAYILDVGRLKEEDLRPKAAIHYADGAGQ